VNAIATINGTAFKLPADYKSDMLMIRLLLGRNKLDFFGNLLAFNSTVKQQIIKIKDP
jgi:hypothetical protein